MKRVLATLFGSICLVALGSVASASAAVFTATTQPCSGGANVALCYESAGKQKLLLTGEQSVSLSSGAAKFVIHTTPIQEITCTASTGSGTISQKEPTVAGKKTTMLATFHYSGCKLSHVPSCEVNKQLESRTLEGTFVSEGEVKLQRAYPGTTIIEYEYKSEPGKTCSLLGKHSLTGSVAAEVVNAATPEATKTLKTFGEALEYFGSKGSLTTEPAVSFTGLNQLVYVSKEA